jgi:hypothetical protein
MATIKATAQLSLWEGDAPCKPRGWTGRKQKPQSIERLPGETDADWKKRYQKVYYQLNKSQWKEYESRKDREVAIQRSRQYYAANKQAAKIRDAIWLAKNRDKVRASARRRYLADIEARKASMKENYQRNKAERLRQTREWHAANPEKVRVSRRKWAKSNPGKVSEYWATRDARKKNACPSWADMKAIRKVYNDARAVTKATGIQQHVDHIIPLLGKTVCGLHVAWNLRIVPAQENMKKGNKVIVDAY